MGNVLTPQNSESSGIQSTALPISWSPPPFIKNPLLRWGLMLGLVLYLYLSVGMLEVNWTRIYEGLDRGAKFVFGFMNPNFAGRWSDISEGIIESLMMTVTSTVIGIAISIPIDLQLAGDKFCFAFPSRNETIINFFPPKFVIVSLLLLEIGAGHLKLALFKDDIRSEKKGRSADLTLFS